MQAPANSEQPAVKLPASSGVSLAAVLVLFLAAVVAVNPLRETPLEDDWAYAETVKHFLETGRYRLNDWLSANIAFQTVWGALFCQPAGFSYSALRISTIALAVMGLVAFRALALEHGLNRIAANLLTLCIASSPLFFKMSLTFMSDVPFVAVTTVALLLYTRALKQTTWLPWVVASLAGAASILTRQFGVALLGALGVVWLADRQRIARLPRYLVGAALPIAATLWQLDRGWNHSNWAAAHNLNRQRLYLFGTGFLKNIPWRPLVILEYLAWFLMPLALVLAIAAVAALRNRGKTVAARSTLALLSWTAVFVGGVFYGVRMIGSPGLMPFLSWNFEILYILGTKFRIVATAIAVGGGILFASALAHRYFRATCRPSGLHEWFLDATTFFSLLLALIFFLIGDEYLLIFLPFAAIAVGKAAEPVLVEWRRTVLILCFLLLTGAAIWTREGLCRNEAIWTLAERLHARGVRTDEIFAGWEWAGFYHFDDYVRSSPATATTTFADFFERWMAERRARAEYLIVHDPRPPAGQDWETVDRFQYFSVFSRGTETFYAVHRTSK
jgi:4-amino-4-deoxy-L-arabinose transferase-like glycosyltransferase